MTEYYAVIGPTLHRAAQQIGVKEVIPDPFPLLQNGVWSHKTIIVDAYKTAMTEYNGTYLALPD